MKKTLIGFRIYEKDSVEKLALYFTDNVNVFPGTVGYQFGKAAYISSPSKRIPEFMKILKDTKADSLPFDVNVYFNEGGFVESVTL